MGGNRITAPDGWVGVPPVIRRMKRVEEKPQDEAPTVLNLNSIEALALELHGVDWQKPAGALDAPMFIH